MKNKFLFICATIFFVAIGTQAQIDTMYFYKNGTVIDKIATNTFDSITYFKPTTPNTGTVLDIDGNVYSTVTIGTQVWMAENLKTTRYNDGVSVTYITLDATWASATIGAMCWYNHDINNKKLYGGLYNWYAVDVSTTGGRNICPTGWHVPSDAEWTILENYLTANGFNYDGTIGLSTTGQNKIAKAMATPTGWQASGTIGAIGNSDYPNYQNLSGFNALPAGYRNCIGGTFYGSGTLTTYWSWTYSSYSFDYTTDSGNATSHGGSIFKAYGYSIRCVKD